MLELLRVPSMHRNRRAIHMQLTHQRRWLTRKLRTERMFL
jgi:hypothetical protein